MLLSLSCGVRNSQFFPVSENLYLNISISDYKGLDGVLSECAFSLIAVKIVEGDFRTNKRSSKVYFLKNEIDTNRLYPILDSIYSNYHSNYDSTYIASATLGCKMNGVGLSTSVRSLFTSYRIENKYVVNLINLSVDDCNASNHIKYLEDYLNEVLQTNSINYKIKIQSYNACPCENYKILKVPAK